MAMVAEALGLAVPGSAMLPARLRRAARPGAARRRERDGDRARAAARCRATWSRAERSRTPAPSVAATGGSTNAGAAHAGHRARGRHRASRSTTSPRVFARTPLIGDLRPGGTLRRQGRARRSAASPVHPQGAARRAGTSTATCLARHGPHARRGARRARRRRTARWCARRDAPIQPTGGLVVLKGNLAPDGALHQGRRPEVARASKARRASSTARKTAPPR